MIGESQAKSRATKGDPISEEDEGVWGIVLFPTVVGKTKDGCRVGGWGGEKTEQSERGGQFCKEMAGEFWDHNQI